MYTDIKVWLKLLKLETFTLEKLLTILDQEINLTELLNLNAVQLKRLGFTDKQVNHWQVKDDLQVELKWLEQDTHDLVTFFDDDYPTLLKEIIDPPLALFVQGNKALLSNLQLAIVGSRNPTPIGAETAFAFAEYLAAANMTITSGLATGIDAAAHHGALMAKGKTIAVCGTGLQQIYPAQHLQLAEQIANNGALVSEFPLMAQPRPYYFPKRNRIISGLSVGTLVVEAAQRSGSLITARLASEQGREVFAIPGSIHNPLARGCHHLLRQGAKLVETAADILEELSPLINILPENKENQELENTDFTPILDQEYQQLLSHIDYDATPVDVLIARSGLPAEVVSSMLLLLELQSLVESGAGGYRRV